MTIPHIAHILISFNFTHAVHHATAAELVCIVAHQAPYVNQDRFFSCLLFIVSTSSVPVIAVASNAILFTQLFVVVDCVSSKIINSVPLYLNLVYLVVGISQLLGSTHDRVLIFFTPREFTSIVQAPVFAVVGLINTSIPSLYAVGAGVRVKT